MSSDKDSSLSNGSLCDSRISDTTQGYRIFNSEHEPQLYLIKNRAAVEARICAGILGQGPLTFETMITEKWAREIYSLKHRGVSRAGFTQYLAEASRGAIEYPLFPGMHQATAPIRKIEQLPNLFLDKQSLAHKLKPLQEYAAGVREEDLSDRNILEKIQRDLRAHKFKYFGTSNVEVVIVLKHGLNDNVLQAFSRLPHTLKGIEGKVTRERTQFENWEVDVDGYSGTSQLKNEARMIALVKRYLDESFDGSRQLSDDVVPHSAELAREWQPSNMLVIG